MTQGSTGGREFRTRRRVEFADTDMEGIVHFARFLVYMETAEHELLEAAGARVAEERDGVRIGWPRVRVTCEYLEPARFGDVLEIRVRVLRRGTKSMTYGFVFEREGQTIARGEAVAVCCQLAPGPMQSIAVPPALAARLVEVAG